MDSRNRRTIRAFDSNAPLLLVLFDSAYPKDVTPHVFSLSLFSLLPAAKDARQREIALARRNTGDLKANIGGFAWSAEKPTPPWSTLLKAPIWNSLDSTLLAMPPGCQWNWIQSKCAQPPEG